MVYLMYYIFGIIAGIIAYFAGYNISFAESLLDFLIIFSVGIANFHIFLIAFFGKDSCEMLDVLGSNFSKQIGIIALMLSLCGFAAPFVNSQFELTAILAASLLCIANAGVMLIKSLAGKRVFVASTVEFVQDILTPFTLLFLWFTL